MEKTWRWFGKKDKITLDMLRQIGVEEDSYRLARCAQRRNLDRRGHQRFKDIYRVLWLALVGCGEPARMRGH